MAWDDGRVERLCWRCWVAICGDVATDKRRRRSAPRHFKNTFRFLWQEHAITLCAYLRRRGDGRTSEAERARALINHPVGCMSGDQVGDGKQEGAMPCAEIQNASRRFLLRRTSCRDGGARGRLVPSRRVANFCCMARFALRKSRFGRRSTDPDFITT